MSEPSTDFPFWWRMLEYYAPGFSGGGGGVPSANLVNHIDAREETGYSEGDQILTFIDLAGVQNWTRQGSRYATYRSTGLVGKPAYSFFDGGIQATKFLCGPGFPIAQSGSFTIYVVGSHRATGGNGYSLVNCNPSNGTHCSNGLGNASGCRMVGRVNGIGNVGEPTPITLNQPYVWCWLMDGSGGVGASRYALFRDGVLSNESLVASPTVIDNNPTLGTYYGDASSGFQGEVGQMLIYDAAHPDAEIARVADLLKGSWGF